MRQILIYDDEEEFREKLEAAVNEVPALQEEFKIAVVSPSEFDDSLKGIKKRLSLFRKMGFWDDDGVILDAADVFIVDYDLFEKDPILTGEEVAYLARCFTECGLIIGVNQFRKTDFDLTLKGHPESFADLNVNVTDRDSQLSNPNLWGKDTDDFHPWHWPAVPSHHCDFKKRVEIVREKIGEPIWEVIGFPRNQFEMLPRAVVQFLGGKNPLETTFRDFVVESGNGLRPKDTDSEDQIGDDVIARVGAARISKWLERLVLPNQTILMDAPHLISQYPSLLEVDSEDIKVWNVTARRTDHVDLGLRTDLIEDFRLKEGYWSSRPVWFWDGVRKCEDILEVREPWEAERPDWVFCEDASRFYKAEDCREFVADTEPPFSRRFVKYFEPLRYAPQVRFFL